MERDAASLDDALRSFISSTNFELEELCAEKANDGVRMNKLAGVLYKTL